MPKSSVFRIDDDGLFLAWSIASLAIWFGLLRAILRAWVCDDAFISYRYAQNLLAGQGLVFNAGERVEGYTNFLWTIWISFGMMLGFDPEKWSVFWGIVFYIGTILILIQYHFNLRRHVNNKAFIVPLAAIAASLHPDWNIFASSGLETSLFTFLLLSGFCLLISEATSFRRILIASFIFSLASLVRPDGAMFGVIGGIFIFWVKRDRLKLSIAYFLLFAAIVLPYLYWRMVYYNDFLPNTYYAKSADISWFSQGFYYVRLYFQRYWIFVIPFLGLPFIFKTLRTTRRPGIILQSSTLALVFSALYLLYLMRVGGDFMFARMLIPITPFLLVLLENALFLLPRFGFRLGLTAVTIFGMLYTPAFFAGPIDSKGVVNEWFYYHYVIRGWDTEPRRKAAVINKYFEGLPLRIAFFGAQARFVYYLRPAVAIECDAGLTDYFTARLPLTNRGRIGHEKKAPLLYLIKERKIDLMLDERIPLVWNREIPYVPIQIESIRGCVLRWNSKTLAILKQRGAKFDSFPNTLDQYISQINNMSMRQVQMDYRRFQNFYFDYNYDPLRKTAVRLKALPAIPFQTANREKMLILQKR